MSLIAMFAVKTILHFWLKNETLIPLNNMRSKLACDGIEPSFVSGTFLRMCCFVKVSLWNYTKVI